ncbi:hypothetical protein ACOMHN_006496 [Nucella lapillus]
MRKVGAVAKLLWSRSPASWRPLPKKYIYALSSIAKQHQLLSRVFPSSLGPSTRKPAFFHGTSSTPGKSPQSAPWTLRSSLGPSTTSQGQKPALFHGTSSTPQKPWEELSDYSAATIWEDVKDMRSSPIPALVVGLSGLLPFMLPPAYMLLTQTFISKLALLQNTFGATVLSFVGGVRWGFVIAENSPLKADWNNFGYSTFIPLVAWAALLLPQTAATLTIMVGVAGSAYIDTAIKGYPSWYKGLRFILSLGTVLSLWTVLLCKAILSPRTTGELDPSKVNKFGGSLSVRAAEGEGWEEKESVGKSVSGEEEEKDR